MILVSIYHLNWLDETKLVSFAITMSGSVFGLRDCVFGVDGRMRSQKKPFFCTKHPKKLFFEIASFYIAEMLAIYINTQVLYPGHLSHLVDVLLWIVLLPPSVMSNVTCVNMISSRFTEIQLTIFLALHSSEKQSLFRFHEWSFKSTIRAFISTYSFLNFMHR